MSHEQEDDLGFVYRVAKNGTVLIHHNGRLATTLRAAKAIAFIEQMNTVTVAKQQQVMARLTGNYRRGNERTAKNHPRNR